jgi:hypothetical protein
MPWPLVRIWARRLALFLDRVARRLEDISTAAGHGDAKSTQTERAVAALAKRFPGAPDHWLRDIAARAPHIALLPEPDATDPVVGMAKIEPRSPSRTQWWWPHLRKRGRPLASPPAQHVAAQAEHRSEEHRENVNMTATTNKKDAPLIIHHHPSKPRATLRFDAPPAATEGLDAAGPPLPAPERTAGVKPRGTRLRLAIVESRQPEKDGGDLPPHRALPQETPRPPPQLKRLPHTAKTPSTESPGSAIQSPVRNRPSIDHTEQDRIRSEQLRSPNPVTGRGPIELVERAPPPTASARRPIVDFSPVHSAKRQSAWKVEGAEQNWPPLPPPRCDIPEAPVGSAKLDRLRLEQDRGTWSE